MKVGDTIIRIKNPSGNVPVGTITTIEALSDTSIRISFTSGWYSIKCFKLVKQEQQLINFLP